MNYLGIDWGKKRIGLALADSETQLALPFKVVNYLSEVLDIIKKEDIDIIVLGKPLKLSNDKDLDPDFNNFLLNLRNKVNKKIELVDERLTTKASMSLSGKKRDKADRDSLSASLILQSYFEKNKYD